MCGIVGFWDPRGSSGAETLSDLVRAMANAIAHRGPDGDGVWVDPAAGIALGHRRLAIIDLSTAASQPMASGNGRWLVTYNGEIYNHADVRRELEAEGRRFRTHSDTEVMLEAFDAWGVERALGRFIGMFAMALWDRQERKLTLIRDRMGVKPLYFGRNNGVLFFGSQPKSFRPHPAWRPEIDRDAIAACLAFNYIPAPLSVWRGIRKLRPGHFVTLDAEGNGEERCYWNPREIARGGAAQRLGDDPVAAEEELHALLSDAVKWRLVADVPVGAFLSGGIDSSTVVALMQRHMNRPAKTFTIGFREGGYDEAPAARAVARHLGTDHTELYLGHGDALDGHPDPAGVLRRALRRRLGDPDAAGLAAGASGGDGVALRRRRRRGLRRISPLSPGDAHRRHAGARAALAARRSRPGDHRALAGGLGPRFRSAAGGAPAAARRRPRAQVRGRAGFRRFRRSAPAHHLALAGAADGGALRPHTGFSRARPRLRRLGERSSRPHAARGHARRISPTTSW